MIVDSSQKFTVVNSYGSCEDAIKHLNNDKPDIVLMDIELPGGMNGIKGTKLIKDKSPNARKQLRRISEGRRVRRWYGDDAEQFAGLFIFGLLAVAVIGCSLIEYFGG